MLFSWLWTLPLCGLFSSRVRLSGGGQSRRCRLAEEPHSPLDVLGRRCQEELLSCTNFNRRRPIRFLGSANKASTFFLCRFAWANSRTLACSPTRVHAAGPVHPCKWEDTYIAHWCSNSGSITYIGIGTVNGGTSLARIFPVPFDARRGLTLIPRKAAASLRISYTD